MAKYFATAYFELNGYGWTETYYRDGLTEGDLAALADFDRNTIWTKRALCLGQEARISAQRTSFDDVLGDSVLNFINLPGNPQFTSEDPNTALLVRLGNVPNTRRKNVFMRGIPDDVVVNGGLVNGGQGAFFNAAKAFFNAIVNYNYGWRGSDTKTDMGVTNYTSDDAGRVVFTLLAGALPAQPAGTKITVRGKGMGAGGKSVLNTTLPCLYSATPNTLVTAKPIAAFPYVAPGGFLTRRTYALFPAANFRFQKVDTRKAGKVSGLQAGRARVRPKG